MAASVETPGTRYHRPLALCLRSFPASRALQKQLHLCTSSLTALTQTKQDSPPRLSQEPSAPKAPPAPRTAASQHGGDSLTTRGSLLRTKHDPNKQQSWTPRKRTTTKSPGHARVRQTKGNMPTQKPPAGTRLAGTPLLFKVRVLKATTKSPGHAGVLQTKDNMPTQKPPACTRLAGTPLLFKVRVLKASTKNAGLTPLTPPHGHSNLKVEPQTKTTATWRAQSERNTG